MKPSSKNTAKKQLNSDQMETIKRAFTLLAKPELRKQPFGGCLAMIVRVHTAFDPYTSFLTLSEFQELLREYRDVARELKELGAILDWDLEKVAAIKPFNALRAFLYLELQDSSYSRERRALISVGTTDAFEQALAVFTDQRRPPTYPVLRSEIFKSNLLSRMGFRVTALDLAEPMNRFWTNLVAAARHAKHCGERESSGP